MSGHGTRPPHALDPPAVAARALVAVVLLALIVAVYLVVVVGVGRLAGTPGGQPNAVLSIVATAIVAFGFEPVRERVRRVVHLLVYGRRASPYEVVAELAARTAQALSPDEVLPAMAEAAAQGTSAVRARVTARLPEGGSVSAAWPGGDDDAGPGGPRREEPVVHQGTTVGRIEVEKAAGERLTAADTALLRDLAAQAGLALRNVALTTELQARLDDLSVQTDQLHASRQRIVTARVAERRRMERDIQDSAYRQVLGIARGLRRAEMLLDRDPPAAATLFDELRRDAQAALDKLRDLARGIYPPLLVVEGLVPALRAHVHKQVLPVTVEADPGVAALRYDAQVEAAAYFCCLEALYNAVRHCPGCRVTVRVEHADGCLTFAVTDDGPGFEPDTVTRGAGLQNIEDRVEALGGELVIDSVPGRGTTIAGRLPARTPASDRGAAGA